MKTHHLQQKLEEEKTRIEAQLARVGRRNPSVPGDWEQAPLEDGVEADPIDQAEIITERDNDAAVFNALESRYDAILAALARIEQGTYGRCEVCAAPIAPERLEVNPSATTCALHMR